MDMEVSNTGQSCQETDPAVSVTQAGGPECPGSVGSVNGKPYCSATSENPARNDQPVDVPGSSNVGNPSAGDTGGGGTGPGRTPGTGGGGPEGGPGGTGSSLNPGGGGSGSGTVQTPAEGEEQAACGAPGQPACRIDETGTPRDGTGKFEGANKGLDQTKDGFLDELDKVKDLKAPEWTWTFQLPTGCTMISLEGFGQSFDIDVCRFQPVIHDLMTLIWIASTIGCCIIIVNRTMSS